MNDDESAFYYVDGYPTKGCWIDLNTLSDEDEIKKALCDAGYIQRSDDGEPVYDGDLLVADVEGELTRSFLDRLGCFDLKGFIECRDDCDRKKIDYEAAAAYISYTGSWSLSDFFDVYQGKYDSEKDFAEQLADETMDIPEHIAGYFDYEAYARDLFIDSFYYDDDTGYVFRRN